MAPCTRVPGQEAAVEAGGSERSWRPVAVVVAPAAAAAVVVVVVVVVAAAGAVM